MELYKPMTLTWDFTVQVLAQSGLRFHNHRGLDQFKVMNFKSGYSQPASAGNKGANGMSACELKYCQTSLIRTLKGAIEGVLINVVSLLIELKMWALILHKTVHNRKEVSILYGCLYEAGFYCNEYMNFIYTAVSFFGISLISMLN